MRIGVITGEYPPLQGGVGAYSQIIAHTLAVRGHEIFVFSNHHTREDNPAITLTNTLTKWRIGSLHTVRQWAIRNRLEVVNLQYQTAAFGMSPWIHFLPNSLRGVPFVTTFHDLLHPYLFPKAGRLRDKIVMRLARASAGVIVTNHEDMVRVVYLPHATLIPIGSNILTPLPDDFNRAAWREQAGASDSDFLIAHFGFVNRSKGLEALLHSLATLRKTGVPARLVMIGGRIGSSDPSNIPYADEIDSLIAQLGLGNAITWTGFIDDSAVTAYLAACDTVVLPFRDGASYRRGSLMAAIQHGCAIVTTQPKVTIPTFKSSENMLLFPVEDVSALTKSLQALYHDPVLRATLGDGARALNHHFDWGHIASEYEVFFAHTIRNARS